MAFALTAAAVAVIAILCGFAIGKLLLLGGVLLLLGGPFWMLILSALAGCGIKVWVRFH